MVVSKLFKKGGILTSVLNQTGTYWCTMFPKTEHHAKRHTEKEVFYCIFNELIHLRSLRKLMSMVSSSVFGYLLERPVGGCCSWALDCAKL